MWLYNAELVGDWSVEGVFDCRQTSVNSALNPDMSWESAHGGFYLYDSVIGNHRFMYYIRCTQWNSCEVWGEFAGSWAFDPFQIQVAGTGQPKNRIWLRVEYNYRAGEYRFFFRIRDTDPWVFHNSRQENQFSNWMNANQGGKPLQLRLGVGLKVWNARAGYPVGFDLTNFRLRSNMPGARTTNYILPAGSSSAVVPLTRYINYRVGVTTVGTDGSRSATVFSSFLFIGQPANTSLPSEVFVAFRSDFTGGARPTKVIGGTNAAHNWPNNYAPANPIAQGREMQRLQVDRYRLYDRNALVCESNFFGEYQNSGQNPRFQLASQFGFGPNPFAGYALFVVSRVGALTNAAPMFAMGNRDAANTDFGYGFWWDNGASRASWRMRNWGGDTGAVSYTTTISPQHVHVWSLNVNMSMSGQPNTMTLQMFRDGKSTNISAGGMGVTGADNVVNGFFDLWPWFRVCTQEDGSLYWRGEIFEILGVKRRMDRTEMVQFESTLRGVYFSECLSLDAAALVGSNTTATAGTCVGGTSSDTCSQTCAAGTSRVAGALTRTCQSGRWTSAPVATCGAQCPALSRPPTSVSCTRVLQWEPFARGTLLSFPELANRYPTVPARQSLSSTLSRWASFPPVPDTAFPDSWSIIPGSAMVGTLTAATRTALSLGVDIAVGGGYDSIAVWAAGDQVQSRYVSVISGEGQFGSLTGVLRGSLDTTGRISPLGSTPGFGLVQFDPAWQSDGINTPSNLAFTYSMRTRIIADQAGMWFRCNTGAQGSFLPGALETSSCYLVELDVEAMANGGTDVVQLWKLQNGATTMLATVAAQSVLMGFGRGRWTTLSVRVDQSIIQVSLTDDATGRSQVLIQYGEATLPPGGGGPYVDGQALFDDYQVTTACAVDGTCSGIFSNYHTGLGGACLHTCTPGYTSTGNTIRTCGLDGSWGGSQLVCSPQPPVWAVQRTPGDGGAVMVNDQPTFTRSINEKSPMNTILGLPVTASSTSNQTSGLPIFYAITGGNTAAGGLEVFQIGLCDGLVRVRTPLLDFKLQPVWTLSITATATGDAGSVATINGVLVVNVMNIDEAPVVSSLTYSVPEASLEGTVVGTLTVVDPDDGTALAAQPTLQIISGNELGLFTLGPNPPLTSAPASFALVTLAAGVNRGTRPGTFQCSCSRGVNFEALGRYTLQVRATDGRVGTLTTTTSITITIGDVNDLPFMTSGQVLTIDENTMGVVGGSTTQFSATDEDAGQTLSYVVTGVWGGTAIIPPLLPSIPLSQSPFVLATPAAASLSVAAGRAMTYGANDAVRIFQGFAVRGVYIVQVQATDNGVPALSFTQNVTISVTANITGGAQLGTITAFTTSTGGVLGGDLQCNGTASNVLVTCDYCSLASPLTGRFGPTAAPNRYNSTCRPNAGTVTNTPGMRYTCPIPVGTGNGHSWTFFQGLGANAIPLPATGSVILRTNFAPPTFQNVFVQNTYGSLSLTQIWTSWTPQDPFVLTGFCFGPLRTAATMTLVGANPMMPGATVDYAVQISSFSDNRIVFGTTPGTSAALAIRLLVDGQQMLTNNVMGYTRPNMRWVYMPADVTSYTKDTIPGDGGRVCVKAWNLGPVNHPGVPGLYQPWITFGPWVGLTDALAGKQAEMQNCQRGAVEQEDICCVVPPGAAGTNLMVRISVGQPPRELVSSWYVNDPTSLISFRAPVITAVVGMNTLNTAGGETFRIRGTNLCSPRFFLGMCTVSVTYGPVATNATRYTAVNCAPVTAGTGASATVEIACSSVPGTGRGYAVRVSVADQLSNIFVPGASVGRGPAALGYAAPVITAFGGASANANTAGGDAVIIAGLNFGAVSAVVRATYTFIVSAPVPTGVGNQTSDRVTYLPASCTVTVPHTELRCVLSQGVGAALDWTLVVDDTPSAQPSTSYAPPVITGLQVFDAFNLGPVVSGRASTDGGNILRVLGTGFSTNRPLANGAVPLLQSVSFISPYGREQLLRPAQYVLQGDGRIDVTIPAGAGDGWTVRVRVADTDSDASSASFSYEQPRVTRVVPNIIRGGDEVLVFADNLGLTDTSAQVFILFGNPIDASLLPLPIRATRIPRPDNDNSTTSPFLPGQVKLIAPVGQGAGRVIRAVTVGGLDQPPNVLTSTMQPQTTSCPNQGGTILAGQSTRSASTCIGPQVPDLVNYVEPVITSVAVTRPSSAADLSLIAANYDAAVLGDVKRLDIFDMNLGSASYGAASALSATFVQQLDALAGPNSWGNDGRFFVPPETSAGYWTDSHAVVFTLLSQRTIRVVIRSGDWAANALSQTSNPFPFADFSPVASVVGNPEPFSTIGGDPLLLQVQFLGSAQDLSVTIDGRNASICDPTVNPPCSAVITTAADLRNKIVNNPAVYQPEGVVTPDTTWTVAVRVPAGQGRNKAVRVIRLPDLAMSSPTSALIDYKPPVITSMGVQTIANGPVTPTPFDEGTRYTVPTAGGRVVICGSNLGVCPVILLGTTCINDLNCAGGGYKLYFCTDLAAGITADKTITSPLSPMYDPTATLAADHSSLSFMAPGGEGMGVELLNDPRGWSLLVSAGCQTQVDGGGRPVRFGWAAPSVTGVVLDAVQSAPTRGGVTVSVLGNNFGQSVPGSPQAALPAALQVRVFMGKGPFVDPGFEAGTSSQGALTVVVDPAAPWRLCTSVRRVSHTLLTCTLPEGAGAGVYVRVHVQAQAGQTPAAAFSYNRPTITGMSYQLTSAGINATDNSTVTTVTTYMPDASNVLQGRTAGGFALTLMGQNFGPASASGSCVLVTWRGALSASNNNVPTCDGMEGFPGEGEVPAGSILSWSHEAVVLTFPPGVGAPVVTLQAAGQGLSSIAQAAAPKFMYSAPVVTAQLSPATGGTDGGDVVVLTGNNFGPSPPPVGLMANLTYPLPLASRPAYSFGHVRINWGPLGAAGASSLAPSGACISSARSLAGAIPVAGSGCGGAILSVDHTTRRFVTLPGVGANISVSVTIVDGDDYVTASPHTKGWDYAPPSIQMFNPNPVQIDAASPSATVLTSGFNFGSEAAFAVFPTADRSIRISIDRDYDVCRFPARVTRDGSDLGVECELQGAAMPVGYKNVSIVIAGQEGMLPRSRIARALLIVCSRGSYGRPDDVTGRAGEICLPCPAGATCLGYVGLRQTVTADLPARTVFYHMYPLPMAGFYDLNSTFSSSEDPCPSSSVVKNADGSIRDSCMVPCDPPESCLTNNRCAEGDASKAPSFRCASCDRGYYRRAGECIKCPDSPAALFVGFILLVIVVAVVGFYLNKKNINIAVISIGVDFFQVLAIFAQTRIKWPPIVKEILHVLSAFNLNIEIVAPECLIPDVSYRQKFWFIMLLPLCIAGLFLASYVFMGLYKMLILGRPKKQVWNHYPTLTSSCLVLLYLLYLYLTRTIMDVFNCAPTVPPTFNAQGKAIPYLQVVFEECGKAGGTQVVLLPAAIAGLAVYVCGYPCFVGYTLCKNRELVMEDQLLRAKGVGNDRLSNPRAFDFRMTFGRSYFQFKPDTCMWILAIIVRKLLIAITAVVFNRNSSFQMAACLLIMFLAYAAQVQIRPYLSPGDFEEVLKAHTEASYNSAVHARLRQNLAGIENRGRKKARRNLINDEGTVDRAAVLGVLTGFFFNYNTVEAIMQFCSVIVCFMAIMYQANELNTAYPESRDSVTTVLMIIIIWAIVYFFTVFMTEIVVLYNEDTRAKQMAKAARNKKGEVSKGDESGNGSFRKNRLVGDDGDLNLGKVETATNPLFLKQDGTVNNAANGEGSAVESLMALREPPPPDLWRVFQSSYMDQHDQIASLREQLADAKKTSQRGGPGAERTPEGGAQPQAKRRSEFAPRSSEDSARKMVGSSNKTGASLKSLKGTVRATSSVE